MRFHAESPGSQGRVPEDADGRWNQMAAGGAVAGGAQAGLLAFAGTAGAW